MKDQIINSTIETYGLLNNVDKSILLLNPLILDHGYKFIQVEYPELEERFKDLFNLPKKYDYKSVIDLDNGHISMPFHQALSGSGLIDNIDSGYVVFLKSIENLHQKITVKNGAIKLDRSRFEYMGKFQKFSNNLIDKLRLFKNGSIEISRLFQLNSENNHIGAILTSPRELYRGKIFKILGDDLPSLQAHLISDLALNQLSNKAKNYFDLSYKIQNCGVKFVTLTTALECLFNRGDGPITHIVSRHLALLLSDSPEEFDSQYKELKKLYGIRSQIVHGRTAKPDICEKVETLQNYVRKAIIAVSKTGISDLQELFVHLNRSGVLRSLHKLSLVR